MSRVAAALLLINPNSSAVVTDRLAAEVKRIARPGIVIRALINAAGPEGIQTTAELDAVPCWVLATTPRQLVREALQIGIGDRRQS